MASYCAFVSYDFLPSLYGKGNLEEQIRAALATMFEASLSNCLINRRNMFSGPGIVTLAISFVDTDQDYGRDIRSINLPAIHVRLFDDYSNPPEFRNNIADTLDVLLTDAPDGGKTATLVNQSRPGILQRAFPRSTVTDALHALHTAILAIPGTDQQAKTATAIRAALRYHNNPHPIRE